MKRSARAVLLLSLAVCLVLAGFALAQEDEREPTISEEYRVKIDAVGNAHTEDTVKYSDEDFDAIKQVVEKNPTFLTRRYTTDSNIGEVEDFDSELNDSENTVAISFYTPGYAYNMKDYWVVFGYPEKPTKTTDREVHFEYTVDLNNEFTLFTDQTARVRTIIEMPPKATNVRYDRGEKAIKYELPRVTSLLGFWSEKRTTLAIVFGLLTLVFAGLFAFVCTRKTRVGSAPATAARTAVTPAQEATATAAPPAPEPPPVEHKRFCTNCGAEIAGGERFCTNCGASA